MRWQPGNGAAGAARATSRARTGPTPGRGRTPRRAGDAQPEGPRGRLQRQLVVTAPEQLGLSAHAGQLVEELSGGQLQCVAIARALALQPRMLIADEPTAELDPAARTVALARIFDVAATGRSLVIATHHPEVAERCDHTLDLRVTVG